MKKQTQCSSTASILTFMNYISPKNSNLLQISPQFRIILNAVPTAIQFTLTLPRSDLSAIVSPPSSHPPDAMNSFLQWRRVIARLEMEDSFSTRSCLLEQEMEDSFSTRSCLLEQEMEDSFSTRSCLLEQEIKGQRQCGTLLILSFTE